MEQQPLVGRQVFLFTNRKRGREREAFVSELELLGATDPRVYETRRGSAPGPSAFPPDSVVVLDTTFMSHKYSSVIRRRARASKWTLLRDDRLGVGGLTQRLAWLMDQQSVWRADRWPALPRAVSRLV
jgi:hypothetical protein